MGKRQVTVAAVQMQCTNHPQENLKKAEKMVRQAAAAGAQIILLSELFEREYFCQQRRYDFYSYVSLWKKMKRYAGDRSWRRN